MNAVNAPTEADEQGLTQREVATLLKLSLGKVNRLVRDGDLDLLPNGRVSQASVDRYRAGGAASPPPAPRNTAGRTASQAKADKDGYDAKLKALDYAERVGAITPTAEVEAAQTTLARHLRDGLLALPAQVAPSLINIPDPRHIEATLRRHINQFLAGQATALHDGPSPA